MTLTNAESAIDTTAAYLPDDPDLPEDSLNVDSFLQDVISGLQKSPREIPCKYFYDERGSFLFTEICRTREYYITRTELALLDEILPDIAIMIGRHAIIIEYGSGEGRKIRNLLAALRQPRAYVPIDISAEILLRSSRQLRREFPHIGIHPMVADYTTDIQLPEPVSQNDGNRRVVFFPGSTISNFTPREARQFLCNMQEFLRPGDALLLGVDLVKSPALLHSAYNDHDGITAKFNLNLLNRINRELGADFDLRQFEHYAFFNPEQSRVEMHLVSLCEQVVNIGDQAFCFAQGENIHTENSYKYTLDSVVQLGQECGFSHRKAWSDSDNLFSIHYLVLADS